MGTRFINPFEGSAAAPTGDITSNLVAYWTLDEGTGTSAADSSGNGYTGTLFGGTLPTWVTGKIGAGALTFNGANRVDVASTSGVVNNPTAITVTFWMKATSSGTIATIVGKLDDYASGAGWAAMIFAGHLGLIYQSAGGATWYFRTANGFNPLDGVWHHVVMTYSHPDVSHVYIDGVDRTLTNQGSGSVASASSTSNITVGGSRTGATSAFYTGSLDDVRIYDRILTQDDVNLLYAFT